MKIQIFGSGGLEYLPYAKKKVKQLTEGKKLFETKQKIHIPDHGVKVTVKSDQNETIKIEITPSHFFKGDIVFAYFSGVKITQYIEQDIEGLYFEKRATQGIITVIRPAEGTTRPETTQSYPTTSVYIYERKPFDGKFVPMLGITASIDNPIVRQNLSNNLINAINPIIPTRTSFGEIKFKATGAYIINESLFVFDVFSAERSAPNYKTEYGVADKYRFGRTNWITTSPQSHIEHSLHFTAKETRERNLTFQEFLEEKIEKDINSATLYFNIRSDGVVSGAEVDRTRYKDGSVSLVNLPLSEAFGTGDDVLSDYSVRDYGIVFYNRISKKKDYLIVNQNIPLENYNEKSGVVIPGFTFVYKVKPSSLHNNNIISKCNVDISQWFVLHLDTILYSLENDLSQIIENPSYTEEDIKQKEKEISMFKSRKYILAVGSYVFGEQSSILHSTYYANYNAEFDRFSIVLNEEIEEGFDFNELESVNFKINESESFMFLIYSKGYARQKILASDTEPQIESKKKLQKDLMLLNKNL